MNEKGEEENLKFLNVIFPLFGIQICFFCIKWFSALQKLEKK